MTIAIVPAPASITPEKVPEPPPFPIVSVLVVDTRVFSMLLPPPPLPVSAPTVWLVPFRSSLPAPTLSVPVVDPSVPEPEI